MAKLDLEKNMGFNINQIKICISFHHIDFIRFIDRSNILYYNTNSLLTSFFSFIDSMYDERKTWQLTSSSINFSCKIERKVKIDKHEMTFDHLDFYSIKIR